MIPFIKKDKKSEDKKETDRKKKKDDKKSWGKKERFLVFFVLFLTVGSSAVLGLSARNWKLPGLPRISPKDIQLPVLSEKTIVIEKDEEAVRVIDEIKNIANNTSGVWGLYVEDIEEGSFYGYNENEVLEAASLVKLPVMLAMYIEEERGNLDLEDIYVLEDDDKSSGAGILKNEPAGTKIAYRRLVELMGKHSDNTAFNAAVGILGEEKVKEIINEVGMDDTSFVQNTTTPKDVGMLLVRLERGDYIAESNKKELLEYITDTEFENLIPQGVPSGVEVAHKYGSLYGVRNDAGIIYAKDPFVLVIMSEGVVESQADEIFPELTQIVYESQVNNR